MHWKLSFPFFGVQSNAIMMQWHSTRLHKTGNILWECKHLIFNHNKCTLIRYQLYGIKYSHFLYKIYNEYFNVLFATSGKLNSICVVKRSIGYFFQGFNVFQSLGLYKTKAFVRVWCVAVWIVYGTFKDFILVKNATQQFQFPIAPIFDEANNYINVSGPTVFLRIVLGFDWITLKKKTKWVKLPIPSFVYKTVPNMIFW